MAHHVGIPGKTGQRAEACRIFFHDCLQVPNVLIERDTERGKLMESVGNSLDRFEIWIVFIKEMYKADLGKWFDPRKHPFQSGIRGDLCNEILNGTRQQRTWIRSLISVPPSDMDISSSKESDSEFANYLKQNTSKEDSANSQSVTESDELCRTNNDIITGLMRIAMQVDNSSLNSKFDLCQLQESDSVEPEITRVREKLPRVRRNEPLARKLGTANAQRRKWLESRRQNYEDFSIHFRLPVSSVPTSGADNRKNSFSFNAKVLAWSNHARRSTINRKDAEERLMAIAKIVSRCLSKEKDEKEPESIAKRTKPPFFFFSLLRLLFNPRKSLLLFPETPSNLPYETPVRRPYCYAIVVMSDYDEWQRHVFADLSCYTCTFEGCPAPLFETRQQWFQHEMEVHRKRWRCDGGEEFYHSSWDMKRHLTQKHSDIIGAGNAEAHAERLGRPPQIIRAKDCPLCDPNWNLQQLSRWMTRDWEMIAEAFGGDYLGKHLEDLSLLALPPTPDMKSVFRGTGDISNLTGPIDAIRQPTRSSIKALKIFWWETYLTFIVALSWSVLNSPYSFLHL
ncbi:hypothetical protein B0T13DRAFT_490415 [Neurospora crassa]|nr:hypothetical protein B0T13DRAFT_490415 [Neurospora crassa]